MNLAELQRKLIAAARSLPPDERVPYAFEKRIMARLAGKKAPDAWSLWGQALSRAAFFCGTFAILVYAGSFLLPANNSESLSQQVEQTLLAAVDNNSVDQEIW